MKDAIKKILAFLGALFLVVIGWRTKLHYNSPGTGTIRDSLKDSAKRAIDIRDKARDAASDNRQAGADLGAARTAVDNAKRGVEEALGIVDAIRKRGGGGNGSPSGTDNP